MCLSSFCLTFTNEKWPRNGSPGHGFECRPLNWLSFFAENPFPATPGPGEAQKITDADRTSSEFLGPLLKQVHAHVAVFFYQVRHRKEGAATLSVKIELLVGRTGCDLVRRCAACCGWSAPCFCLARVFTLNVPHSGYLLDKERFCTHPCCLSFSRARYFCSF